MSALTTAIPGASGTSSESCWTIFNPAKGEATYTLITKPTPVKKKVVKKTPSWRELNKRLAATEGTAIARAEAATMRLIGRKQV